MRYFILIVLLCMPVYALAGDTPAVQAVWPAKGVLVRAIRMDGFVLDNKKQFERLFKPYVNKHLSQTDLGAIQEGLDEIYEQAGYKGLVAIDYHIARNSLTFTVSLIK